MEAIGISAAQAVLEEAARLQREDFCAAKREFVKKYGAKEFQDQAKYRCETQPPTATAIGGGQIILDKECRAILASGC